MSFTDEMEKRLRRVMGVTDDEEWVNYEIEKENGYGGGCDTCGYGADTGRVYVTVYCDGKSREFSDLGELMRALDAVQL
jgi:hypothetical protein